MDLNRLSTVRLEEPDLSGVQEIPAERWQKPAAGARLTGRAIKSIADHRVAQGREVNTKLMRATGMEDRGDESEARNPQSNLPVCPRGTAFAPACGHADGMMQIPRHGELDASRILFQVSMEQSEIDLADLAFAELLRQAEMRGIGFGDKQHARSAFVEAMNDSRAKRTANVGKVRDATEAVNQGRSESAGVPARAGMNNHSGGFSDDGDVVIFVENFQGDGLGQNFRGRWSGNLDAYGFAGPNTVGGFAHDAGDHHAALVHQRLDPRAAEFREASGEVTVQTGARVAGRDDELKLMRTGLHGETAEGILAPERVPQRLKAQGFE